MRSSCFAIPVILALIALLVCSCHVPAYFFVDSDIVADYSIRSQRLILGFKLQMIAHDTIRFAVREQQDIP